MKGSVSSRRLRVFPLVLPLVAALSVVWVAFFILMPNAFPWSGLGWVALALSGALWARVRQNSTRSIAEVLQDVETEPLPAVAAKSRRPPAPIWGYVAWLSLLPVSLLAGTPDPAANLSACRNGWPSCEYGELTPAEAREVTLAERQRNLSNCRNGWEGCERSKLSERETADVEATVQARNLADCKDGRDSCDYSLLSRSEAQAMSGAERVRNYAACLNRRGYCDLSRLTPSEAASIPPEVR